MLPADFLICDQLLKVTESSKNSLNLSRKTSSIWLFSFELQAAQRALFCSPTIKTFLGNGTKIIHTYRINSDFVPYQEGNFYYISFSFEQNMFHLF